MGSQRVLALALVAVVGVGSVQAQEPERRGPVLLFAPEIARPLLAAGSESQAEVSLELAIDERGRVVSARALGAPPASDLDRAFAAAAERGVREWRFAPATRGERAIASQLRLAIQFKPGTTTTGELRSGWGNLSRSLFLPLAEVERARELRRLTATERAAILERYVTAARKRLAPDHTRRIESPRFVVISDAREPDTAERVAGNLEATFNVLHGLFDGQIEPLREPYKLICVLFRERAAFYSFLVAVAEADERFAGVYLPPGLLAFHQEAPGEELLSIMLHEAVHAFSNSHLQTPGSPAAPWLEEGLAEYIANSEVKGGALVVGRTLKRRLVLHHAYGLLRGKTRAALTLDELRGVVARGEAPGPAAIVHATREQFSGEEAGQWYGLSWLFFHFLAHGEEGWAQRRLPRLLLYLLEGFPVDAALEQVYGQPAAALDPLFRAYVKRF